MLVTYALILRRCATPAFPTAANEKCGSGGPFDLSLVPGAPTDVLRGTYTEVLPGETGLERTVIAPQSTEGKVTRPRFPSPATVKSARSEQTVRERPCSQDRRKTIPRPRPTGRAAWPQQTAHCR